jgi:hypothetical protein
MTSRLVWLSCLAGLLAACPAAPAAAPPVAAKPATAGEVRELADQIDQHLRSSWAKAGVTPAAPAGDAEFLRRVYLDLAGRIPTVAETRAFLKDDRADRRARVVEGLLASPRYATHFTNVFRALLIPEAGNNFQVRLGQGSFEGWLKSRLSRNAGYDRVVREVLTAKVAANPFPFALTDSPLTFYLAKEYKPENLAAGAARVFLGVSVECAQCHNHPFAEWKREQFWGFAAFFAGMKSNRQNDFLIAETEDLTKRELSLPGSAKVVRARFLDGGEPKWAKGESARSTLADWVVSPANPYFARATVNRLWAYFFGAGLVEPLDEMVGGHGKNYHPELLDLLAREFVRRNFDLKFLFRTLTATRAYQLTSAGKGPHEPWQFARMPLRGLTAEQLFDSVSAATGFRDSGGGDDLLSGLVGGARSARSEFLTRFAPSDRPTESQTSILQALTLMNGKVTAAATTLAHSETLAAVADAPFATLGDRVEALYLATLSRKPSAKELGRATRFVQTAVRGGKHRRAATADALADVFWALLNSPEFAVNH